MYNWFYYRELLLYAASNGNLELVKHLMDRGADGNSKDEDDYAK